MNEWSQRNESVRVGTCITLLIALAFGGCAKVPDVTSENTSGATASTSHVPHPIDPLADARAVSDEYLAAVRIIEIPEGQAALTDTSWGGQYSTLKLRSAPSIRDAKTLHDGLFETDTDGVKGYRRLIEASVVSKGQTDTEKAGDEPGTPAGIVKVERYLLVAYPDAKSKVWKVFAFVPAQEFDGGVLDLVKMIESGKYAKGPLYKVLAFHQIMLGQFRDAQDSIDKATPIIEVDRGHEETVRVMKDLGASKRQLEQRESSHREFLETMKLQLLHFQQAILAITTK